MALQELQALRRRQREHPADQRQVDAIFAVIGLRLRIRFLHMVPLVVYAVIIILQSHPKTGRLIACALRAQVRQLVRRWHYAVEGIV